MIYKLRANSKEEIEQALPLQYYEDEQGNEHLAVCTKDYSYVYLGKEIETQAEYDEDGNLTKEATYTGKHLADFKGADIELPESVEQLEPETPLHGWAGIA